MCHQNKVHQKLERVTRKKGSAQEMTLAVPCRRQKIFKFKCFVKVKALLQIYITCVVV